MPKYPLAPEDLIRQLTAIDGRIPALLTVGDEGQNMAFFMFCNHLLIEHKVSSAVRVLFNLTLVPEQLDYALEKLSEHSGEIQVDEGPFYNLLDGSASIITIERPALFIPLYIQYLKVYLQIGDADIILQILNKILQELKYTPEFRRVLGRVSDPIRKLHAELGRRLHADPELNKAWLEFTEEQKAIANIASAISEQSPEGSYELDSDTYTIKQVILDALNSEDPAKKTIAYHTVLLFFQTASIEALNIFIYARNNEQLTLLTRLAQELGENLSNSIIDMMERYSPPRTVILAEILARISEI